MVVQGLAWGLKYGLLLRWVVLCRPGVLVRAAAEVGGSVQVWGFEICRVLEKSDSGSGVLRYVGFWKKNRLRVWGFEICRVLEKADSGSGVLRYAGFWKKQTQGLGF